MSNRLPLADAKQREDALDIARSFIVQAPAGSGKTELLSNRYLTLLATVSAPEEVVAITFTRKAAAEMRARVLGRLEQAQRVHSGIEPMPEDVHSQHSLQRAFKVLAQDGKQQWQLLQQSSRLRIQTFDSLCSAIVRQTPLLSGTGGNLQIEEDADALYQEAARRTLQALEDTTYTETVASLLLHVDNNGYTAQKLLVQMLARRDQWLPMLSALHHDHRDEQWQQRLALFLQSELSDLVKLIDANTQQALMPLVAYALEQLAVEPADASATLSANALSANALSPTSSQASPLHALHGWGHILSDDPQDLALWQALAHVLLTQAGQWRKQVTKANGFPTGNAEAKQKKAEMTTILESLSETDSGVLAQVWLLPSLNDLIRQRPFVFSLLEVLTLAYGQLKLLFKERGVVDFGEVSSAASVALGSAEEPTDLALALDYKIQHLLVDECQDTSRSQVELLQKLTAGWQTGDGRTVFLVGDPMQSIYRFRKAEVGEFLRLKAQGLGDILLHSLTLNANFRSQANLVHWVNTIGPKMLAARNNALRGAVCFEQAQATKPAIDGLTVQCHGLAKSADYARLEAQQVLACIQQALQHGDQSIAVLGRTRGHLIDIATQLRAANMPFEAVEMEVLTQHPMIMDLLQLTRALMHSADRLAWLCVLRAPWCGLSLSDLHVLCSDQPNVSVLYLLQDETRRERLSNDGKARLDLALNILSNAVTHQGRLSLAERVHRSWYQFAGPTLCVSAEDKQVCDQFFAALETFDEQADDGLADILTTLSKLYAKTSGGAAIKLMTMHKSKGLEFDCVILPRLGAKTRGDETPLLRWENLALAHSSCLLVGTIQGAREQTVGAGEWLKSLELERAAHESNRLLYVALTRAKKRLHLFGAITKTKAGYSVTSGSLLSNVFPLLETEFVENLTFAETEDTPEQVISAVPHVRLKKINSDVAIVTHEAIQALSEMESLVSKEDESTETDRAKVIGIVTHAWLEQAANDQSLVFDKSLLPLIEKQLRWHKLIEHEVKRCSNIVLKALVAMQQDKTGKWLLSHQGQSEWALQWDEKDKMSRHIIDRSFVFEHERWIVDYKTLVHDNNEGTEQAHSEVIAERLRAYIPQLERYAQVLRAQESLVQRLAIYFPLQQQCWVWTPGQSPALFKIH